jgi:hypothetical protein
MTSVSQAVQRVVMATEATLRTSVEKGTSGDYSGPYADAVPWSGGPCAHCQLLREDLQHRHEVLAVGAPGQKPVAAWFLSRMLPVVRRGVREYKDWTIIADGHHTYMRLHIPASCHPDGRTATYVWRLVDRIYGDNNGLALMQLGIWAD